MIEKDKVKKKVRSKMTNEEIHKTMSDSPNWNDNPKKSYIIDIDGTICSLALYKTKEGKIDNDEKAAKP